MRKVTLLILLLLTIFIMNSCSLSYLASIPAKNKENENIDKLIQKEENYEFKSFLRTKKHKDIYKHAFGNLAGDVYTYYYFTNNPVRDDPDMEESSMIAADIFVGGAWAIGTTSNLVSALTPESTESLYAMYKKEYDEMKEEERREELEKATKRASQNITYGKWAENVRNDEIAIGMPAWIVEDIMGTPDDTDRTVTSYGTSETWYYERYDYDLGMYWTYLSLYFDDGILTSWHEW